MVRCGVHIWVGVARYVAFGWMWVHGCDVFGWVCVGVYGVFGYVWLGVGECSPWCTYVVLSLSLSLSHVFERVLSGVTCFHSPVDNNMLF